MPVWNNLSDCNGSPSLISFKLSVIEWTLDKTLNVSQVLLHTIYLKMFSVSALLNSICITCECTFHHIAQVLPITRYQSNFYVLLYSLWSSTVPALVLTFWKFALHVPVKGSILFPGWPHSWFKYGLRVHHAVKAWRNSTWITGCYNNHTKTNSSLDSTRFAWTSHFWFCDLASAARLLCVFVSSIGLRWSVMSLYLHL
jgi:hypothetical protein